MDCLVNLFSVSEFMSNSWCISVWFFCLSRLNRKMVSWQVTRWIHITRSGSREPSKDEIWNNLPQIGSVYFQECLVRAPGHGKLGIVGQSNNNKKHVNHLLAKLPTVNSLLITTDITLERLSHNSKETLYWFATNIIH